MKPSAAVNWDPGWYCCVGMAHRQGLLDCGNAIDCWGLRGGWEHSSMTKLKMTGTFCVSNASLISMRQMSHMGHWGRPTVSFPSYRRRYGTSESPNCYGTGEERERTSQAEPGCLIYSFWLQNACQWEAHR